MSTLIGRFNELLHHLSSSTSSASSVSPTHQPPPPLPSSRPSASSRTSSSGHHVHRHASLSAADRPTPVRRSNSASRTKQTTAGGNNSKSTSTSSSRSAATKATEDQTDGHRSRHRSSAPTSSHHNSQRQSNHSSSRRESSGTRRDSASSILHHHHQSRRAPLTSSRRRHSIASLSSVNGQLSLAVTKKPSTPSHGPVMASKVTKKSAVSHKNNNNNNTVSAKPSVIKQQTAAPTAPIAVNGTDSATANESDESLASKFARKMKISAITRKGSNCNSATAAKIVNGVKGSDQQKKQAKTNKKGHAQAEAESKNGENGCFIYRYLNGHLVKQHPDIISGKTCYDLPIKDIEALETKVVASCTGPSGGLLTVDCTPPKPFDLAGDEVDFIDEDYPDSSLSSAGAELSPQTPKSSVSTVSSDVGETLPSSSENASPVNEFEGHLHERSLEGESTPIAGIADWTREKDFAFGISTSLYESHPSTKQHAGDPIADSFAVCVRENSSIIALADGVNWGEKACLASRCAVYGCMDYLNKALYSPAESTRIRNTLDIFVALLRSFNAAHDLILAQGGHLTTLCAAVICQLRNSDRFIVCTCNVGDSLAYVYSPLYGVREITAASHDIFSMRDMRDALGALGPVSGKEPELNNLTVAMTVVDVGDIVFLTSDGISDNFDPVVGKFAMPKKAPETKTGVTAEAEGEKATAPVAAAVTVKSKEHKANKESEKSVKARKAVQRSNSNPERGASRKLPPLNPDNYTAKGLPLVSAQQRHELALLRMEDLIMNGVNSISVYDSSLKKTAKELCTLMLDFSVQLTMAKRRILEDPELYSDSEEDLSGSEVFGKQRQRRRLVGHKLVQVPGKLDHASIAAVEIGFYGSIAAKRASLYHMQQPTHKPFKSSNKDNTRTTHSTSNRAIREEDSRYNLKMKAPVARFESQDFLECCCEAGPI